MSQTVLASLLSRLTTDERTGKLLELLRRGKRASSGGLWGSSASLIVSSLAASGLRLLVVTPSAEIADEFADDINLFLNQPPDLCNRPCAFLKVAIATRSDPGGLSSVAGRLRQHL